jgi:hypothetical protein
LLDRARPGRAAARYEYEVDQQHKEHQDRGEVDRRLDEEICRAANAEHCANATRSCETASEALALRRLSKYD